MHQPNCTNVNEHFQFRKRKTTHGSIDLHRRSAGTLGQHQRHAGLQAARDHMAGGHMGRRTSRLGAMAKSHARYVREAETRHRIRSADPTQQERLRRAEDYAPRPQPAATIRYGEQAAQLVSSTYDRHTRRGLVARNRSHTLQRNSARFPKQKYRTQVTASAYRQQSSRASRATKEMVQSRHQLFRAEHQPFARTDRRIQPSYTFPKRSPRCEENLPAHLCLQPPLL